MPGITSEFRARFAIIAGVCCCVAAVLAAVFLLFDPRTEDDYRAQDAGHSTIDPSRQPATIRPEIREVIRAVSSPRREWELIGAVQALGSSLTTEETAAIAASLVENSSGAGGYGMPAVNWNSMLNLLRTSNFDDPDFLNYLANICRDESIEIEIRDYAVQHTEAWLRARDSSTGRHLIESEDARAAAHEFLIEAASRAEDSFSGTAATSLVDLAGVFPEEFEGDQVDVLIRDLLESEKTHPASRVSALQLAAERGLTDILPAIRELVADEEAPAAMKLSAIAAMGKLGLPGDLQSLKELLNPDEPGRFDVALKTAIERIAARSRKGVN